MKRLWIGIGLLVILLAVGAFLSWGLPQLQNELAQTLELARVAIESDDWQTATSLADSAKDMWEHSRHFVASVVDHEPLEEVDSLFSELEVYAHARIETGYASVCAQLSHLCEAIGESQQLRWWSFL